jgi:hypothetical protein
MKKIINAFLQWFDDTWVWKWFAKNILAHLTFRIAGYPRFDFDRFNELRDLLDKAWNDDEAVYAFVLADKKTLASILIRAVSKSRWSHAGWLTRDPRMGPVAVHMKGSGLVYHHVANTLRECDDFAVVRIEVTDKQAVMGKVLGYAKNPGRVRYDFEQELSDDLCPLDVEDIYCSELVWICAKDHAHLATSEVLGRVAFSPEDVARSGEIVWSHITTN